MTDYKEVRASFDVRVYDTIDQRYETFPMTVNLWELGWPDEPQSVAMVQAFLESTIGIDVPNPDRKYAAGPLWHHIVMDNLLAEVQAEANYIFDNDNLKRVIRGITVRQIGGSMPKDWRDENLWPKGLKEGERPWDKDPDFYEYPMSDWRPGK